MTDYDHIYVYSGISNHDRDFLCVTCGLTKDRAEFPVLWSRTVSKRRFAKMVHMASKSCRDCYGLRLRKLTKHPLYSRPLYNFCVSKLTSISGGASARGIDCLVSAADILEKILNQRGVCAISGVTMTYDGGFKRRSNTKASLDRIDSFHPYTPANTQWVCAIVNVMKNDLPQTDFLRWCGKIVQNRRAVETELLDAIS